MPKPAKMALALGAPSPASARFDPDSGTGRDGARRSAPAASFPGFRIRARLQHFRAGRALGVFQLAMLGHDERAAERDHHENPQQPAKQRHQRHPRDFEIDRESELPAW